MKNSSRQLSATKSLKDVVDLVDKADGALSDVGLAAFLACHAFQGRKVSIGSIGGLCRAEAIGLNTLVSHEATFVVLSSEASAKARSSLDDVFVEIEARGFSPNFQYADLTILNRWPQILAAMANSDVGILGVDSTWAANDPNFWSLVQHFCQNYRCFLYMRGLIDPGDPLRTVQSLRSIPDNFELSIFAATNKSVWFVAGEAQSQSVISMIRSSGLFLGGGDEGDEGDLEGAVIVRQGQVLQWLGHEELVPRFLAKPSRAKVSPFIHYHSGWSNAESDGMWTSEPDAIIALEFPKDAAAERITITGNAWIPPDLGDQLVLFGVGDQPDEWTEVGFLDANEILEVSLDLNRAGTGPGPTRVHIHVKSPGRPSDHGGQDSRLLGFKLREIAIF